MATIAVRACLNYKYESRVSRQGDVTGTDHDHSWAQWRLRSTRPRVMEIAHLRPSRLYRFNAVQCLWGRGTRRSKLSHDDAAIPQPPTPAQEGSKRMPDWAKRTFTDFLDDTQALSEVLHLCIQGVTVITRMPALVRALHSAPTDYQEGAITAAAKLAKLTSPEIDAAEYRAALAQREVDNGFNTVHSQGVLSLWSALEDLVKTFVARWLAEMPETRREPPWSDLRIKLGEYEQLDEEQKGYYLVDFAEQNTGAAFRRGVNRFECLLDKLGLSGPVRDETAKLVFEMQQVRNVIAHRRGVADKRFCESCPTYGATVGKKMVVSHEKYFAYIGAVHEYVGELIFRTGEKFGDCEIRERAERASQHIPGGAVVGICGKPAKQIEEECSNSADHPPRDQQT